MPPICDTKPCPGSSLTCLARVLWLRLSAAWTTAAAIIMVAAFSARRPGLRHRPGWLCQRFYALLQIVRRGLTYRFCQRPWFVLWPIFLRPTSLYNNAVLTGAAMPDTSAMGAAKSSGQGVATTNTSRNLWASPLTNQAAPAMAKAAMVNGIL